MRRGEQTPVGAVQNEWLNSSRQEHVLAIARASSHDPSRWSCEEAVEDARASCARGEIGHSTCNQTWLVVHASPYVFEIFMNDRTGPRDLD